MTTAFLVGLVLGGISTGSILGLFTLEALAKRDERIGFHVLANDALRAKLLKLEASQGLIFLSAEDEQMLKDRRVI